jgi:DedD protein
MATDDSDITLGPGKLLGLFFILVAVCGVFFAIGYSLGKTSVREQAMNDKAAVNASLGSPAVTESSAGEPSAVVSAKDEPQATASEEQPAAKSEPDLTFYNAVKKTDGATQPVSTGTADGASPKTSADKRADPHPASNATPAESSSAKSAPDVKPETAATGAATGSYVVQIAAVSREEDAAALAGALRKKSYNVFVVNNPAVHDKLYHVQVGPFVSLQDAEAMKAKLTGEGYNPIVKRT